MAESKIKYQFGQKSLDMDGYIRNLGNNVRSYIDYNIKHRGWTEDQVNEFSQSYNRYLTAMQDQLKGNTNRFSTNDLGDIIDSKGEFSNTDLGTNGQPEEFYYNGKGERIDQTTYNALKDRKKKKYTTFNANREVAEFFRRVGAKMSEYKDAPKEKFDISKHGFVAWWNKKYNPSGEEAFIEPYLDLDPVDASGKRAVTNRATRASVWLKEYLDSMKESDLDFSDYAINNRDEYIQKGQALQQEWANGNWNPEDLIKAQEFGIGSNWSKDFFSTEKDPRLSDEQRAALQAQEAAAAAKQQAEAEAAKKNKQDAAANTWRQEQISKYNSNLQKGYKLNNLIEDNFNTNPMILGASDPFKNKYITSTNDGEFVYANPERKKEDLKLINASGINITNNNGMGYDPTKLYQAFQQLARNPHHFDSYTSTGILGALLRLAIAGGKNGVNYAQLIQEGKYAGSLWFPHESTQNNFNRALIYNPQTKQLEYVFVGYIPKIWGDMTSKYLRSIGKDPTALNPDEFKFEIPSNKEGGTLKYQYGGGISLDEFVESFNDANKEIKNTEAKKKGVTIEALEKRMRPVSKGISSTNAKNDNFYEQQGGWTKRDYWQLGNIGADIVSMLSAFAPGYGTLISAGTGAGSTISQYIHDLTGDVGFLEATGNAVVGLGLDALGLVPGWGATSKAGKIAKNLFKYTPKLMAFVAGYQGLKNGPEIMTSLRKASKSEDLTVEDWKNIAQAIGLATTGVGGTMRHINTRHVATKLNANSKWMPKGKARNITQASTDTGDIALQLRNKKTNLVETRRFTGDEAKAIKAATSPKDIEKIISKKPSLGDYELVTTSTIRPHFRWGWPPTYRPERVRAMAVKKSATGTEYSEGKGWLNPDKTPSTELTGEASYRRAVLENDDVKRAIKASQKYEGRIPQKASKIAETDKSIADIKKRATQYQRDNGLTGGITEIDRQLTTINAQRTGKAGNKKNELFKQKKQDLNDLQAKLIAKEQEIQTINSMAGPKEKLDKAKEEYDAIKKELDDTKNWLNDHSNSVIRSLKKHRAALENFDNQIKRQTQKKTYWEGISNQGHTVAFTNLRAKINNGKLTFTDPNNPSYTIEKQFGDLLREVGIKYKLGGKFVGGGNIRDVRSTADWYTDMYSSNEMQNWLKNIDTSNYQNFNHLQTTWKQNLINSEYTPGGSAKYNAGVLTRQPQWNQTGTNAVIGRLNENGTIVGYGGTTDNAKGNYTDGYFGSQEYLRHGGSRESWNGHSDQLQALKDAFKAKNLEYYEDTDGMFKLRPIKKTSQLQTTQSTTQPQIQLEKTKSTVNKQKLNNYIDPKWMALGQAFYANKVNDIMTNRALKSNKPVLQPPKMDTRYMQGNLDAIMEGERAAGQIMHLASQPIVSDGAIQTSTYIDAIPKAEPFRIQGKTTNNNALRERRAEILKQRIDEHFFNYDAFNKNRLSIYQALANKTTLLNAHDAKNYDNYKTLSDEFIYDKKIDWNKRKSLQESLDRADIHSKVLDNLSNYVTLTPEEEAAWNKVKSGVTTPSKLEGNEAVAYKNALKKASQAETNQLRILYGINPVEYAISTDEDPITISKQGGVLTAKDGSKIRIAKIRAKSKERIKDADRLYKSIKDRHDRTDRNITRADKKMYPLSEPISARRKK